MFCTQCGKKEGRYEDNPSYDGEYNFQKYVWVCGCGHKRFMDEKHLCPADTIEVRTTSKDGYQTCHIPKLLNPKDFWDKDYHSVNIAIGLMKKRVGVSK